MIVDRVAVQVESRPLEGDRHGVVPALGIGGRAVGKVGPGLGGPFARVHNAGGGVFDSLIAAT